VAGSPAQTLQSMLEIEFVGAGNAQMAGKMDFLQDALALSRQVLTSLTAVQNLANQIQVNNRLPEYILPSPTTTTTTTNPITGEVTTTTVDIGILDYRKLYKASASAYFSQIFPSAVPIATAAAKLLQAKQDLWNQMLDLEAASPVNTRDTKGTLANAIYLVVKDISTAFNGIVMANNPNLQTELFEAVKTWIIDNQDIRIDGFEGPTHAGEIQDRITAAISSAQNLEEGQRENVRRFLFIFQQFYKSAAAMITLLGQLFDKINKGIEN
jgi:hypothetical protein